MVNNMPKIKLRPSIIHALREGPRIGQRQVKSVIPSERGLRITPQCKDHTPSNLRRQGSKA